jgi:hypothetical protein
MHKFVFSLALLVMASFTVLVQVHVNGTPMLLIAHCTYAAPTVPGVGRTSPQGKLLNSCEDDAAVLDAVLMAYIIPALGLDGGLAKQVMAEQELTEDLAVGGDDRTMHGPPAKAFQSVEGILFDVRFSQASHAPSGSGAVADGFSLSLAHRSALSWMYCRMRLMDSSFRMICS